MPAYVVSYDLRKNRNYEALYDALKSHDRWGKITESTWVIVSSSSAVQIRDSLQAVVDGDDRIFVIKSGVEAAWLNVKCKNEWLKENL
jgi:hypothetical protein